ncbi:hypothetical protein SAMN02745945_02803 [Peptoclostridium litorale DSM 5388]|uniref:TPR repeat family protein n=1 Tax=Peptoclostridium litorale DSM 5388 TaxID=1121324 RepID=A0A069RL68_PEPLI|nr:hypothetical protein [Peptoclostridium litorale]KDR94957.1 TPR repeat family protein [Peptoclostridium litorale DSM 5388]SIO33817.1 hypothetical protein SAMN02745945_02803 [Peptoclostridium litorale DSM 5388]
MNFFKRILLSLVLVIMIPFASGCSSSEESAEDVLKKYYNSIENGQYKNAYECLSDDVKKDLPYDIFTEYYDVVSQTAKFKGYAPGGPKEIENVNEAGSVKYKKAVVVPVEEIFEQIESGEQKKIKLERMLVSQDGKYRLVWENNMRRFLSDYYVGLANKAISSDEPDFDEAKRQIDMAAQKDEKNPAVYYYKAILSNQKKDYDGAFESIQECIEIQEKELAKIDAAIAEGASQPLDAKRKQTIESISYAYNIKGIIHGNRGKVAEALSSFKKALEYCGDNQYAKMNIDRINVDTH